MSPRVPSTPLEQALSHILAAQLGTARIDGDDDFFSLGGDVAGATAAAAQIRTWLDLPTIDAADIVATRTVTALASRLRDRDWRLEQVAELFLEVAGVDLPSCGSSVLERVMPDEFARWIRRFEGPASGAAVIFPHAGGAAASYRPVASAISATGPDVFVLTYPQHPGRMGDAAESTIADLAADLFASGPWERVAPLRLFGHCMGAVVAFEFAKLAERHGIPIARLWASGGAAPSAVSAQPALPTTDPAILADVAALGGTDPRLLDDPEFVELLLPGVRADYVAMNRYSAEAGDVISADIGVISARDDVVVGAEALRRWSAHTSGRHVQHQLDGGHFAFFDHLEIVARLVNTDV